MKPRPATVAECCKMHPTRFYLCTLPRGHEGDHVAHGIPTPDDPEAARELARWPTL